MLQTSIGYAIALLTMLTVPVAAEVAIAPQSINLATKRARLSKTVRITADEAVQTLTVEATDLENTDGSDRILAADVAIDLSRVTLTPNQTATAVLTIGQLPGSGEYTGALVVRADDSQQVVPLVIRVKDPLPGPLLTVVAGVLLGSGLSWYRAHGRPRDEVVVQAGRLRAQLRSDPELSQVGQRFQDQIEGHLIEADAALEGSNWSAAADELTAAQTVWNRWRKGRTNWIDLLVYCELLAKEVAPLAAFPYGQTLQAGLTEIDQQAATAFETPAEMSQRLNQLLQWLTDYRAAEALLDQLSREIRDLPADRQPEWKGKRNLLEHRLQAMQPADDAKFEEALATWRQSVAMDLQSVMAEQTPQGATLGGLRGSNTLQTVQTDIPLQPVPGVSGGGVEPVRESQRRLNLFNWGGRIVAVALLSWAGLVELYEGNPAFGASPLGDYFVLIAWGFGAEVTRESVVKAIQDLTTPLKKKEKS
ncbi:MAG: hypothetical protein AAFR15_14340 [Cyanobacteria bacterium J06627_15]